MIGNTEKPKWKVGIIFTIIGNMEDIDFFEIIKDCEKEILSDYNALSEERERYAIYRYSSLLRKVLREKYK